MKRAMQKLKVMIAAALCAAGIGVAQAVYEDPFWSTSVSYTANYLQPGIYVNGHRPKHCGDFTHEGEGNYSYWVAKGSNNDMVGMYRLTTPGATYRLSGQDTRGRIFVRAEVNCTIELADGLVMGAPNAPGFVDYNYGRDVTPIVLWNSVTVKVIAKGTAKLYACGGPAILVQGGQTLYYESEGSGYMYAYGDGHSAGIGTAYGCNTGCGIIYIRGAATVHAGDQAAGIGLGSNSSGNGYIYIDRDTADLTVEGYHAGSAIGTSYLSDGTMNIIISAGTVKAKKYSRYGAAIGTGASAKGTCNINITGGTVTADAYSGGGDGAGIGQGSYSTATMNINISGGKVTAFGGENAAGIGGAEGSNTPKITITGGTVVSTGDPDVNSVNDIGAGRSPKTTQKTVVKGGSVALQNGKGELYSSTSDGTPLKLVTVGNLGANQAATVSLST